MSGSDVLLTGSTGFAGSAVLPELVRAGYSVTALVREPIDLDGARSVVGSLGTLDELADEIARADAIVHLASGRTSWRERVLFEDVLGTGQLLDAWARGPFIHASTSTVHGIPAGVITEATPVDIVDWYDCGKVVNEFQVREAAAARVPERGPGISLRPTLFFGRSQRSPERQYLGWFLDRALAGQVLVFDSEEALGTIGASYIGIGDFGRAVVAALDLTEDGAYPVASGFVTWKNLYETVNRLARTDGRCIVRPTGPSAEGEFRAGHSRTELDDRRFRQLTGWVPQETLEELVQAFLDGEREAGRA